ncbi:hypothetical protein TGPRC2_230630 [Toxoplasma gondii TgCatPRC2]|uniref:RNA-editing substrate-binding complex 6 protein domain-containing protein n=1 Tax=Toxoplasma gondii TgCatPRC2 TaxID=1130821 RepID=A0A151HDZ5_TOXGO|nr:hypothetical protein TGPRC2_230630 [Toxoplasma gondii TgCatPRC2]
MRPRALDVAARRGAVSRSPSYFPGESVAGPPERCLPRTFICMSVDRRCRGGAEIPRSGRTFTEKRYNTDTGVKQSIGWRRQQNSALAAPEACANWDAFLCRCTRLQSPLAPTRSRLATERATFSTVPAVSLAAIASRSTPELVDDGCVKRDGHTGSVTHMDANDATNSVNVEMLGPFALTRSILKAFREDERDVALWRRFASRARVLLPSLPPSSLVPVLGTFATLGYRDRDLLVGAAEALIPQLSICTGKEVCRVTHHYAQLLTRHDLLFSVCARELARRAHELQPNEVARVLHSYARLGYFHPHLFAVLRRRVFEISKRLEPGALVLVLSAAARLRLRDEKLLAVLAAEICRRIADVNVKGLAVVANVYAEMGVENSFLLDILADEAFRKRHERRPQDAALLLRALGRLGRGCLSSKRQKALVDDLTRDLPRHIKKFSLEQVSMTVAALSRLWGDAPQAITPELGNGAANRQDLLEALGDRVGTLASDLTPQCAAALIFAFAKLGHRHGPLLYHIPEHVERFLPGYSLDQLAKVCFAYSKLHVPNAPVLHLTLQRLPELLRGRNRQRDESGNGDNTGRDTKEAPTTQTVVGAVDWRPIGTECAETGMMRTTSEPSLCNLGDTETRGSIVRGCHTGGRDAFQSGLFQGPRRKSQSRLVRLYAERFSGSSLPSSPPSTALHRSGSHGSGPADPGQASTSENGDGEAKMSLPGGLSPSFSKALVKVGPDGMPEKPVFGQALSPAQPRLHSILRILRAMLQLNVFDKTALTLIGDHLADRAPEMEAFSVVTVVDLYAAIGFLHRPLMEKVRIELRDPREGVSFTQDQLRCLFDALQHRLQLSPSEFGVLRVPRTAVTLAAPASSKMEILTSALLRTSAHLDTSGGSCSMTYSVAAADAVDEGSSTDSVDDKRPTDEGSGLGTWFYLHVPAYLETLLQPEVQQAIASVAEDAEALEAELTSFDFPVAHTREFNADPKQHQV